MKLKLTVYVETESDDIEEAREELEDMVEEIEGCADGALVDALRCAVDGAEEG